MLVLFGAITGIIFGGTIFLAKNSFKEKRYIKMISIIIAGFILFIGVSSIKEIWKQNVRTQVLDQTKKWKLIGVKELTQW